MNVRIIIPTLVALFSSSAAHAATITVTGLTSLDCDLAAAVALANGPDSGTHPICVRANEGIGEDPVDTIDFAPSVPDIVPVASTLSITAPLVIDGDRRIVLVVAVNQRHFEVAVEDAETVTFDGLGLRAILVGGGVRVASGTLVVSHGLFDANRGAFGGAVHVEPGAVLEVTDTTFSGNAVSREARDPCIPEPVALGAVGGFVVLGASTVTNTGPSAVTGDLGVSPGTEVTGFPPGIIVGTIHANDPIAAAAQGSLTAAYDDAASRSACSVAVAGNIGGSTLGPGLYTSTSSLAISSGDLVLDGGGDANAVFIFQMASTLITSSDRKVLLINGAQAGNVFWQIGSSATLGTNSVMVGTLLVKTSITLTTGASLVGRALASTGAVTLDSNTIVAPPPVTGTGTGTGAGVGLKGAGVEGGAVDCLGTCSFDRVLFVGNTAIGTGPEGDARGGAINALDADVVVRNSTFVDNRVGAGLAALVGPPTTAHGGAIAARGGTLDITFATFTGNTAERAPLDPNGEVAGGALHLSPDVIGAYRLYASIVSDNDAGTTPDSDCFVEGALTTGYDVFETTLARQGCTATNATDIVGEALLSELADNGGPTETVRIPHDSAALNHVPSADCALVALVDQRGYVRPMGTACDAGALELENLSLAIDGPSTHLIPAGAVAPQTVTLTFVVTALAPADDVTLTFTAPVGVTVVVRDGAGDIIVDCAPVGAGVVLCQLGDLVAGDFDGTIELTFPASRTTAIAWNGLISFAFEDADPLDDVDGGLIAILYCGDDLVSAPEVCDDGGAVGGCDATCAACVPGFEGDDCLDCAVVDDGNVCTDDTCDALGPVNTPNTASCDDGSACTTLDTCAATVCVGGPAPVVDDGNPCTTDSCDALLGAVNVANTLPCDDGDLCTTGDVCAATACVGGVVAGVDDGDVCTDDLCDPVTGAVSHVDNVAPCDDGDACTTEDACAAGACVSGSAATIDDGDACTLDSCDPVTGVVHTPNPACVSGLHEAGGGGCAGGGAAAGWLALLLSLMALGVRRVRSAR